MDELLILAGVVVIGIIVLNKTKPANPVDTVKPATDDPDPNQNTGIGIATGVIGSLGNAFGQLGDTLNGVSLPGRPINSFGPTNFGGAMNAFSQGA